MWQGWPTDSVLHVPPEKEVARGEVCDLGGQIRKDRSAAIARPILRCGRVSGNGGLRNENEAQRPSAGKYSDLSLPLTKEKASSPACTDT
jgi:hypothetical protein